MMNACKRSLRVLLAAAAALMATVALAGEITLFQNRDFHGERVTLQRAAPDLERIGFNDTASSIIVRDGVWEACTDHYFGGKCVQLQPGEYRSLTGSLDNRISSVREVASPSASMPPVIIASAEPRLVLYERPGFVGRSVEVTSTMGRLDRFRTAGPGAVVVYGGTWRLCSGELFRGECNEFAPGRYDNLGPLNDRVNSAELLTVPRAPVGIAIPPAPAGRVVLYEFSDFRGQSVVIDRATIPNLEWLGFNDRAASMRIEDGYWMFCTDVQFQGDCRTLGPGEYPRLPLSVDRKIVSARRVNEVYGAVPSAQPYMHWQPMS